jgi:hypothetical protein
MKKERKKIKKDLVQKWNEFVNFSDSKVKGNIIIFFGLRLRWLVVVQAEFNNLKVQYDEVDKDLSDLRQFKVNLFLKV